MRLYIIRHADPDYEKGTITEHGHREAEALARHLEFRGIDRIYCSPIQRAVDTMQYTSKLLNIEPVVQDWTQELDWMEGMQREFKNPWDVSGEIILGQDIFPNHENWFELPQYEQLELKPKFEQLIKDSDLFLKTLGYEREGRKYRCVKDHDLKVAMFCHAGFGLTWLAHLLQIPLTIAWAGFWLAPSSVTTVLFEKRSENYVVPRCIGLGDVSHLYEAKLPTRPRGLKANFY